MIQVEITRLRFLLFMDDSIYDNILQMRTTPFSFDISNGGLREHARASVRGAGAVCVNCYHYIVIMGSLTHVTRCSIHIRKGLAIGE